MSNLSPKISRILLEQVRSRKIAMGFDGFIDSIVRIIREKDHHQTRYFGSQAEFANYLVERKGSNLSLELKSRVQKIGGNMPIMANAMSKWGCAIHCFGAFGYPRTHHLFEEMKETCTLHSYADPGVTTALEFDDGKIILGEMSPLQEIRWPEIIKRIPLQTLRDAYQQSDLVAILNWAELDSSTSIWEGLLNDVLPTMQRSDKPMAFFDLSDCSKREPETIRHALSLLQKFSAHFDVMLGLNANEGFQIASILSGRDAFNRRDISALGETITPLLSVSVLVLHNSTGAIAWTKSGKTEVSSHPIVNPAISTGAGDNFNAGFCIGMLARLSMEECLSMAHECARVYMESGESFDPHKHLHS